MILPLCCCNDENFHQYVSINSFKRYWRYLCTVESRTNLWRISPRYIRSGTKLSLLTETLTGSLVELKRLSTWDFTLTTSTGTVELRFLKRGCLQKKNMTTDLTYLYHGGPPGDQFLPLTMPIMPWLETHQPWARFEIHQSLTTTVVQTVRLSKSTLPAVCSRNVAINIKVTIVRQTIKLNPL